MLKNILVLIIIFYFCKLNFCQKISWNGNDWAHGCSFNKNGREMGKFDTSASQCGNKCFETGGCTHFIWRDGSCFLRHGEVSKEIDAFATQDPKQVCGIVPYRGIKGECVSWNKNKWAQACDFSSDNNMQIVETTGGACFSKCMETLECTHFTWTPYSAANPTGNGKCQMKKGQATRFDAFYTGDQSVVCGSVKSHFPDENAGTCWNRKNWAANCQFEGSNLESLPGVSGEECSAQCIVNEKCNHYSWSNGVCYLKQGPASKQNGISVADSSAICGIVPKNDDLSKGLGVFWNGQKWAMQCAFRGRDITTFKNIEGKFCLSKCAETDGCTHFNWSPRNGGTCSLKHGPVSRSDAFITGDKNIACGYLVSSDPNDSNDTPIELGPKVNYEPTADSQMFMGVCYDAMHNTEYPLHGETPDFAALSRAIDKDFFHISKYFKHVRTFYSTFYDVPVAPYAAKYGIKLYLGVYMTDESWYQNQVDAAIDAVKKYPSTVAAIFIGNENLVPNGPHSADNIISKIKELRDLIKKSTNQNVAIGTVQRINEWLNPRISQETARLADASDIIGVNIYPFFGDYDYKNPIQPLHQQWHAMITRYGVAKVRLTETGFPSAGGRSPTGVLADLKTEIAYYNAVANWRPDGQGPAFWFAFHDRRADDNTVPGTFEKHFGLFTSNGMSKADNFPPTTSSLSSTRQPPTTHPVDDNIEHPSTNLVVKKNNFFVIAHMVSNPKAIDWAIGGGANGIEIDINFDKHSGRPTVIKHGAFCDCTCLFGIFIEDSVCHLSDVCDGSYNAESLMMHVAVKYPNLALIYFDSKTSDLSSDVQKKAGKEIVDMIIKHLLNKGYNGQILIGSGKGKDYIESAAFTAVLNSKYKSRFFFTLDQQKPGTASTTLKYLKSLSTSNIVYSTGVSICVPQSFINDIALAAFNKNEGLVSNVFIWTLDKETAFKDYYDAGARGILTNKPRKLFTWAKQNGIHLAEVNDGSLSPTTSDGPILEKIGNCYCSLHKGGCKIRSPSPQNRACKCIKLTANRIVTCQAMVVSCSDPDSPYCKNPDDGPQSCALGGGDCGGYDCDCDYHVGGCSISSPAPKNTACKCNYKGFWTCSGTVVRCLDPNSIQCKDPDKNVESCVQGGGDCGGYGSKSCDCDYHPGGCSISKEAPKNTACKCIYKGGWTCGSDVVRCNNENSEKCSNPDKSIDSCLLGGGDCEGYKKKSCDCDFKKSGCVISRSPPPRTACKCRTTFIRTCGGKLTPCGDEESAYCKNPDKSRETCIQGGGNCDGYN